MLQGIEFQKFCVLYANSSFVASKDSQKLENKGRRDRVVIKRKKFPLIECCHYHEMKILKKVRKKQTQSCGIPFFTTQEKKTLKLGRAEQQVVYLTIK